MDRLLENEVLLKLANCCTVSLLLLSSDSESTKKTSMLRRFIAILTEYHKACVESLTKRTDLIRQLKPDLDLILTGFKSNNEQRWNERDVFLSKCSLDPFEPYLLTAVEVASEHHLFSTLLASMESRMRTPGHASRATNESTPASLAVPTVPNIALDRLVREVPPLSLGHSQDIEHALYLALKLRTFCSCAQADDNHLHKVMFRCSSIGQNFESGDKPQFAVLFHAARARCVRTGCAHPACHHETDIKVDLQHGSHNLQEIQLGQLTLCEQLHLYHDRKLQFLVTRDRDPHGRRTLYRMYSEGDCAQTLAPIKTLSLVKTLKAMRSEPDNRRLLLIAYILALTIWQYCNTEWMSSAWKPSDFKFVNERDSTPGKDSAVRSYPYISFKEWNVDRNVTASADDCTGITPAALYPGLMSLGMLLIEVGLGPHQSTWEESSSMDSICWTATRILSANQGRWPLKHLEGIASSCFNNKLFVDLADSLGNESLRSLIFKEIVRPLELIYRASIGEELQSQRVRHLQSPESSVEDADAEETRRRIEDGHLLADGGGSSLTPQRWIQQNFDVPNLKISDLINQRRRRNIPNPPPIKVAVLDTGCDGNSRHFQAFQRQKQRVQKHWFDFVQEGSNSLVDMDENKHGTKITTTLLKLLPPKAELYVGRVTRDWKSLKESLGIIKRAIEHAVKVWDVDIISMSWGFEYEIRAITDVIHEAVGVKKGRVLFFAAAGNDGPNRPLMFPASNENVIAVGHTNTIGEFQGLPVQDGAIVKTIYGTLGVDIPYDPVTRETLRGSSFATPIMAASAALLLQDVSLLTYGSHPDDYRTVQRCFEREAMVNLIQGSRNDISRGVYVAPGRFFEPHEEVRRRGFLHSLDKLRERR